MGKHILLMLLGGLLVLGMSTVFAEEPQLSDQEILKAWGQAQTDVKEIAEAATLERKGLKPLTDENLDEITAGNLISNKFNTWAAIVNSGASVKGGGFVACHVLIGACSMTPLR